MALAEENRMPPPRHVKVTLPPDLVTAVQREAKERGRSVSSIIAEAVAARYADQAEVIAGLREVHEVEMTNLRLTLAAFRSLSALVAMAPRIEDDARRDEITERAAEHRSAVLGHLGLSEEEVLGLSGDAPE